MFAGLAEGRDNFRGNMNVIVSKHLHFFPIGSMVIVGLLLGAGCDAATKDAKDDAKAASNGSIVAGDAKVNADGSMQAGGARLNADGSMQAGGVKVSGVGADGKTATVTTANGVIEADANGAGKVKVPGVEVDGDDGGSVKAPGVDVDGAGGGKVKAGGVEVDGGAGTVKAGGVTVDGTGVTLPGGAKVPTTGSGGASGSASKGGGSKSCPGGSCKQVCKDGGTLTCDGGSCNHDTPAFRISGVREKTIAEAAAAAGVEADPFTWFGGRRWFWLRVPLLGQGLRRTRMMEAAQRVLRAAQDTGRIPGLEACGYMQAD